MQYSQKLTINLWTSTDMRFTISPTVLSFLAVLDNFTAFRYMEEFKAVLSFIEITYILLKYWPLHMLINMFVANSNPAK